MNTVALIDGDVFAYRVAAASETLIEVPNGPAIFDADPADAASTLDDTIQGYADKIGADRIMVALSVPRCFRYDVLPSYKSNRKDVRKPILLRGLKEHLTSKWGAKIKPKLEADDVLGIWATWSGIKGKKVIVTIDKDLKQIPGYLFNPMHDEAAVRVTDHEADYWHMRQTLTGDTTDGYKGCPGIGPKKADAILFGVSPPWGATSEVWPAVTNAFAAKKLTEADALQQARVARICRASDYDFDKQEPILWNP